MIHSSPVVVVIGVDPGLQGAIAAIRDKKFILARRMPLEPKPKKGHQIDASALLDLMQCVFIDATEGQMDAQVLVAVERVFALPFLASSSTLSLGDSFGCARSATANLKPLPRVELVPPAVWKKYTKTMGKQKSYSVSRARSLYPECRPLISHPKHDEGLAEALLIAHYALHNLL